MSSTREILEAARAEVKSLVEKEKAQFKAGLAEAKEQYERAMEPIRNARKEIQTSKIAALLNESKQKEEEELRRMRLERLRQKSRLKHFKESKMPVVDEGDSNAPSPNVSPRSNAS